MRASGYERMAFDWYQEPRWIIDALLDVESFSGVSWDPSCGAGNIPAAMLARGLACRGSDAVDRGFGQVLDFFEATEPADNIVTNPPYGVIGRYIERALTLTTGKVAILARLALLEGMKRRKLLESTPLARVWVSSRRVSMPPGEVERRAGVPGKGGSIAYAWFIFEHGHKGPATVGWV